MTVFSDALRWPLCKGSSTSPKGVETYAWEALLYTTLWVRKQKELFTMALRVMWVSLPCTSYTHCWWKWRLSSYFDLIQVYFEDVSLDFSNFTLNRERTHKFLVKLNDVFLLLLFSNSLWILHHTSQSHSSPCLSISALCPCNLSPSDKQTNSLTIEAAMHHGIPHSIPFYLSNFTCKFSLKWVIGLIQGLWLLHYQHWIIAGGLRDILLLPSVLKILQVWVCATIPFTHSSSSQMR